MKWTLKDLVYKIDYEGGLGGSLNYFGREVDSESPEVNEAWRHAYDAMEALRELLPDMGEFDYLEEDGY